MKQAPYWIWTNSSQSNFVASANTSEEEAFAEDAAGRFGAFVWPPRAYHCSFCGREFRSAQALGGHMNVHRRDRARLKQSPSDPQSENPHHHHHQIQSCESRIVEYPDQTCTLVYNPDYNPSPRVSVSQVSPTRNLAPLTQESCYEDSLLLSAIQKRHKNSSSSFSSPPSWSDSDSVTVFGIGDSKKQGAKNSMKQMTVQDEGDAVKSNMSLNLNLVVDLEKGESFSCKRQRIDKEPLPFYLKPSSTIKCNLQSQITGLSTSTMEDVDLELRLGNRPKKLR